jgi:serine/threonine protein kinase
MIRAVTGTTVGHYEILEKLGEGGMGLVYKARDVLLDRTAALKVLPADSASADDKRRRFVQEAQAASSLNHPNIITIWRTSRTAQGPIPWICGCSRSRAATPCSSHATSGQMFYASFELQSNIWLAERRETSRK